MNSDLLLSGLQLTTRTSSQITGYSFMVLTPRHVLKAIYWLQSEVCSLSQFDELITDNDIVL
jgi:hypothetical protein